METTTANTGYRRIAKPSTLPFSKCTKQFPPRQFSVPLFHKAKFFDSTYLLIAFPLYLGEVVIINCALLASASSTKNWGFCVV